MNTYYSNSSNIRIVFATNIRIPKNHYSPNPNKNQYVIRKHCSYRCQNYNKIEKSSNDTENEMTCKHV